ncbi:substrate-binding domain-containing protein [Pseudarthrobacter sulfonivorans]|uniref:molybdate ABC transporter substrate-binding protein n=1 Tax=Pseudarthrobacter sulfonivorans TaxID=121292 RepID=UPI00285DC1CD|nr:substrate-binding domain-containing protein [Pseudarthrobacter sulfonivorans]MDR6415182.1 ABC-type molybdate transport system substrate-binding protein [Pseudarthrobacter sulfonivorans]
MNAQAASQDPRPLTFFCAFALKQAVEDVILPAYRKAGGEPVEAVFEPTFRLLTRIESGARPDVMAGITGALAELLTADIVTEPKPVARTGVGVAVPLDAPVPDISSVEAFITAVTNARSVAYSRSGPSGIYFAGLLERLGIAELVTARATVIDSGPTAVALLDGRADLAIHQLSELILVPEATIVGPLPAAIQEYTDFSTALGTSVSRPAGAADLRDFLHGSEAKAAYAANGLEAN